MQVWPLGQTVSSPVHMITWSGPSQLGCQDTLCTMSGPPMSAQQNPPGQLAGPRQETSALLPHEPGAWQSSPVGELPLWQQT